jgi:multidrug efflux pump subunit AcrA (membrane-fusion protein)
MNDEQQEGVARREENSMVRSHRSADCRRGQVLLAALIAAACCAAFAGYLESSPPAAPAIPPAPASQAALTARVTAAGIWAMVDGVAVVGGATTSTPVSAPARREWAATTAGSQDADVRPEVAGRVARRLAVEDGLVRQGEVLFEIDPRPFQARLDQARSELAAPRDAESAEARRAAVEQARHALEATRVRSPIAGVARALQARVGDLVNPTSVLATVSSIDPIRVHFQLDEPDYLRYLDSMRPGAAATRPFGALELELAPGKTLPEKGYLAATDRQVDLATRTIGAEGLFPNPGYRLRPGQPARIRERG